MTPKHLFILLLALFASAVAQSDDELHIPDENDNQFPPENHAELDGSLIEGSGAGVIDEPLEATTESSIPVEDVQLNSAFVDNIVPTVANEERTCPQSCVCNIEGDTNDYVVDCSGSELTELPKPLDIKTTQLNLQNNKLTSIPKDISVLKNLKVLNANNNEIMQIDTGSISELPELTTLKLAQNRLLEYPLDLKNSFGLSKLEELDLGDNDMREILKPETFSIFKALRKVNLPSTTLELVEDLCSTLKDSLQIVCTKSCEEKSFECQNSPLRSGSGFEDELLDFALPGLLAIGTASEDDADPIVPSISKSKDENNTQENVMPHEEKDPATTEIAGAETTITDFSIRSAIMKAPAEGSEQTVVSSTDDTTTKTETEVVGATTSSTKTGGVDKSVIGLVVAGMVVVIAGITIKKNWSSIKKRFSSSPRPANDRSNANANGTAPEEVPLQEKSPV